MPQTQIGAQLYTLRDFLKTPADIAKTLARVKKLGYDAVQVSGFGPIDLVLSIWCPQAAHRRGSYRLMPTANVAVEVEGRGLERAAGNVTVHIRSGVLHAPPPGRGKTSPGKGSPESSGGRRSSLLAVVPGDRGPKQEECASPPQLPARSG